MPILKKSEKIADCVHTEDQMLSAITYQDVLDAALNTNKPMDEDTLAEVVRMMCAEAVAQMWSNFSNVKTELLAKVKGEG